MQFRSQCLNGTTDEATTNKPTTDKTTTAEASTSAHINLHCAYLNARSIINKQFYLAAYVGAHEFDIIGITETFLDDSVHDSHTLLPGYVAYCRHCNRHSGGVMILDRKGFNIVHYDDLETDCEIVWIKLMGLTLPIVISVFYRPPSATMSVLEQLSLSLNKLSSYKCLLILCGDFNIPNVNWSNLCPDMSSTAATALCSITTDDF